MVRHFTLEYWIDDGWYVGKLKENTAVFSQGENLEELEENIRDAYRTLISDEVSLEFKTESKEIEIEI